MTLSRSWAPALLACLFASGCSSTPSPSGNAGPPVDEAAESRAYLRAMLFDLAADSLQGRSAGSAEHLRATTFLAEQAAALGLEPAGEDGTYFQVVPVSTLVPVVDATVDGTALALGTDVVPVPPLDGLPHVATGSLDGVEVIYGGRMFGAEEIPAEQVRNKVVLLGAGLQGGVPTFGLAPQTMQKFSGAAGILIAALDYTTPDIVAAITATGMRINDVPMDAEGPILAFVTTRVASLMVGGPIESATPGASVHSLVGTVGFREERPEAPTRNVIARLPGSDPALRNEYVVVSAHSDHVPPARPGVPDHDSLRVYLEVVRPRGAENPERPATAEEAARMAEIRASMEQSPPRPDSIFNGADDDASGSVALLEIARWLQNRPPRRSILFVWHTAEELGLFGAKYFTENPTVPIDDMVADLNADMIGRGGADDLEGGGPAYLQLIGSRRLSTQLGDLVEAVNVEEAHGFEFDYSYDTDGHPDNFYCRSDHYMYARFGIPIVFFSTGGHRDYHQLTDEAQYIDYDKLLRVSDFMAAVTGRVANLDARPVVDGPIPDPTAPCQQ